MKKKRISYRGFGTGFCHLTRCYLDSGRRFFQMFPTRLLAVFIVFTLLLVSIPTVFGLDATLTPSSLYEGQTVDFNISLVTSQNNFLVHNITLILENMEPQSAASYLSWSSTIENNSIFWSGGTLDNNVISVFSFNARSGFVFANETAEFDLVLRGDGVVQTVPVSLSFINDETGPQFHSATPGNISYLLSGASQVQLVANVSDPETGISAVTFAYDNCVGNLSGTTLLTCQGNEGGVCTATGDFSSYAEGDLLCFSFIAQNNAGTNTSLSATAQFDGTAPTVALVSPLPGELQSLNVPFVFLASDNVASTLTCHLNIGGENSPERTVTSGAQTSISLENISLTSGNHSWYIQCKDGVGLVSKSQTTSVLLDAQPPTITLLGLENNSVIGSRMLNFSITDDNGIDQVIYSKDLDTINWSEGEHNLTVTALDEVGNGNSAVYTFYVDRSAPTIALLSPADNATSDHHVNFSFMANDTVSQNLSCKITTSNFQEETFASFANTETIVSMLVPTLGTVVWSVTCEDEVGLSTTSEEFSLTVIDTTGPDISSYTIPTFIRGQANVITADVTDPSGVLLVSLSHGGEQMNFTKVGNSGDTYSISITPPIDFPAGDYTGTIIAEDFLGYTTQEAINFSLVAGYDITITLEPQRVDIGNAFLVSGTVTYDNGSAIDEQEIVINFDNANTSVTVAENGTFSVELVAPLIGGGYDVGVSVVSLNGYTYTQISPLVVRSSTARATPVRTITSSSGGGGGGGGGLTSFSSSETISNEPATPIFGSFGEGIPEEGEETPGGPAIPTNATFNTTNATAPTLLGESTPAEPERSPIGVGQASNWFSLASIKANWLAVVSFLIVILSVVVLSLRRQDIGFGGTSSEKKSVPVEKPASSDSDLPPKKPVSFSFGLGGSSKDESSSGGGKINWDGYFDKK